jgi:hypothetical protein
VIHYVTGELFTGAPSTYIRSVVAAVVTGTPLSAPPPTMSGVPLAVTSPGDAVACLALLADGPDLPPRGDGREAPSYPVVDPWCVVGPYGGAAALSYMDLDVHSGGGAEVTYEDIL